MTRSRDEDGMQSGMSRSLRNRIGLAYVFLVGLPLLLIAGTLHVGKGLTAPFAVGGQWAITLEQKSPFVRCNELLPDVPQLAAAISQSGTSLSIVLSDVRRTVINSTLTSARLAGSAVPVQTGACQDVSLAIEANVINRAGDRSLEGRFLLAGCASCGAVSFRAAKVRR